MSTPSRSEATGDDPVYDLAPDCTIEDVEEGACYRATVNGVVEYGVFVDLSASVSGLVHESNLDGSYDVGDELTVRLVDVRENGDLGFESIDATDRETVQVDHEPDITATDDLAKRVGESITVEGELVQIKQTGGPTVFTLRDGVGIVPCAAFEAAGVRAYPSFELGDIVRVTGRVERREGALQLEVESLDAVDESDEIRERLDSALEEQATPHDVQPLVDWPALETMQDDLEAVATRLRRAVLENRPIRIRHHADGDGMCASIPIALALERFIKEVHGDPSAARHLLKRLPSKAPYYEMEDVTRDLNFALGDRDRHGQQLPLLVMLDNGSTEEDVPAYEALAQYDIPIVAVDHHHPDPDAVDGLLAEHVNPYLHGEDYRVTTGMLCVELARMIHPEITDELTHVPAVAGLTDRSEADAMADYLALAREAGYDEDDLQSIGDALDYAAHWLRYSAGESLLTDVLGVDAADDSRHDALVEFFAERAARDTDEQLDAAMPHVESATLDNGADLYRIDVERHAHRFTYPAPGKTTGAIHDRKVADSDGPVVTVGYGPDFAVLRSDGVRLDIPQMVEELEAETDGGVSGGGHLVVGSIKFVKGMREEVLDALETKMGAAEIDEELGSASVAGFED
ncbi:OB-fold nucleic acid binding domain-containing protein [Halococcus dombrowskii]|uniref:OB-fold nucleic acid binding domain-containing protein n=1 Tax=Halococcus dombrowskii TaxID=179637 RepID=A0AAX3AJX6_HALDO|nr:OB-fold nucleic acid binding domain-containing protein [Halococcus dombrowskii]UOO94138.1 OB-fold nucleic acid binding domain-containing protein [Halococcus dombrowskii]